MKNKKMRKLRNQSGASAIEYSLVMGLVTLVLLASLTTLGEAIANFINQIGIEIDNTGNPQGPPGWDPAGPPP